MRKKKNSKKTKRHLNRVQNNESETAQESMRSPEEIEIILKSKLWLRRTKDNLKELFILCMEPFI